MVIRGQRGLLEMGELALNFAVWRGLSEQRKKRALQACHNESLRILEAKSTKESINRKEGTV